MQGSTQITSISYELWKIKGLQFEMVQGVTVTISDGRRFLKGIAAGKKEDLYTFLWEKIG